MKTGKDDERRGEGRARSVERSGGGRLSNDSHPSRGKSPPAGPLDIKLFNIGRIVRFDAFPADFSSDIKFGF